MNLASCKGLDRRWPKDEIKGGNHRGSSVFSSSSFVLHLILLMDHDDGMDHLQHRIVNGILPTTGKKASREVKSKKSQLGVS